LIVSFPYFCIKISL